MSVEIFCVAIDNMDTWWFSTVNYFHKMPHLKCLQGSECVSAFDDKDLLGG